MLRNPDIEGFLKEPPNIIVECLICIENKELSLHSEKVHLAAPAFFVLALGGFQLCCSHLQYAVLGGFMCSSTSYGYHLAVDSIADLITLTGCPLQLMILLYLFN